MTISDDYRVVTTGQILEGFDADDVRKRLASILRLQPTQAERFFDKPRVLKKGVSWTSADRLCSQLATLGVSAEIQSPAPPVASQPAEPKLALQEEPALELGEPGPQGLAASPQFGDLRGQRVIPLGVGDQRLQGFDLGLGLEHRLVGAVEIVEVPDQCLDTGVHREGF